MGLTSVVTKAYSAACSAATVEASVKAVGLNFGHGGYAGVATMYVQYKYAASPTNDQLEDTRPFGQNVNDYKSVKAAPGRRYQCVAALLTGCVTYGIP